MLGSSSDTEDVVQETLTRAFRSRHTLEDDAAVRPWLYRIATNVCLDELGARSRRARGPELGPPSDPDAPTASATPESEWIEPCPGAWTQGMDPSSAYTVKESVALAFVAALQVLTPAQRAVLILREVVELTAEETAHALEMTVSAANSTLHRARVTLSERLGPHWSPRPVDPSVLQRYLTTWESSDFDAIIALLHEEVTLSMPPHPTWISGRAAVRRFYESRVRRVVEARLFRTRVVEANGSRGVAFYRVGDDDVARFFALHLLEGADGAVRVIDHFMAPGALRAFFAAGLPSSIQP
jgi:RNA polymerase sigma-70 factor (ECF subfamily)